SMNAPDIALRKSKIHRQLASLDKCSLFYTTNYDDFIERSFVLFGRPHRTIRTEKDIAKVPTNPAACDIVKFHGDLSCPDKMVLSESDYEKRLRLGTEMDYRLRSDVLGRALLFIGYSFRDWNVSYLFRLVNEQFGKLPNSETGYRAYITVPYPSDFEIMLFKERNIGVIPLDGKESTQEIALLLETIIE
ncbi:MAG: SIR2 family NAD-dependent protein deacylase, partial [Syntrophobacteraceae bacterium]